MPTWLEVHWSKAVFFLSLNDIINDMKYFRTVYIKPQPCHSHFCCWLLPIWPKLDVWAENGAFGLCRLGWMYNGKKLYFSYPYIIVSMIWNNYEMSASHLSRATAIFVVDCCQFGPSAFLGWKWSLWPVPTWLEVQRSKAIFLLTLHVSFNVTNHFWTVCITPQPCHSHFCCWLLPIWP